MGFLVRLARGGAGAAVLAAIVLGTASPAEASAPRVDPVARPHAADQSLHPVVAPQPADARFTPRQVSTLGWTGVHASSSP